MSNTKPKVHLLIENSNVSFCGAVGYMTQRNQLPATLDIKKATCNRCISYSRKKI